MFPGSSVEDAQNYCRNPDNYAGGVWCYTTDLVVRWERCDVPLCGGVNLFHCTSDRRNRDDQSRFMTSLTGAKMRDNCGKLAYRILSAAAVYILGIVNLNFFDDKMFTALHYLHQKSKILH